MIDPEAVIIDRAIRETGKRLVFGCIADTHAAGETLIDRAAGRLASRAGWLAEARSHFDDRPAAWDALVS